MTTPTMPGAARPFLTLAMIERMPEPTRVDVERATAVIEREHILANTALILFPVLERALTLEYGRGDTSQGWRAATPSTYNPAGGMMQAYHKNSCLSADACAFADDFVTDLLAGAGRDVTTVACDNPARCALGAMLVEAGRSNGYIAEMSSTPLSWCYADQLLFWKAYGLTDRQGEEIYRVNDSEPSGWARDSVRLRDRPMAIIDERRARVIALLARFEFVGTYTPYSPRPKGAGRKPRAKKET